MIIFGDLWIEWNWEEVCESNEKYRYGFFF